MTLREKATGIVNDITTNLKDRRGMWPDDLDEDIEKEIKETLIKITIAHLRIN